MSKELNSVLSRFFFIEKNIIWTKAQVIILQAYTQTLDGSHSKFFGFHSQTYRCISNKQNRIKTKNSKSAYLQKNAK